MERVDWIPLSWADCMFRLKGKLAGLILSDLATVKNLSCDVGRAAMGF